MFRRATQAEDSEDQANLYPLDWVRSERWNPQYNVPRSSLESNQAPTAKGPPGGELPSLVHWLQTLSEIYMNKLDNRARWEPRWLAITQDERYGGLQSTSLTVIDYLTDESKEPRRKRITEEEQLAATLQSRHEEVGTRLIVVQDLSRFVMGALGHLFEIDPEFWFNHLNNSGYASSDSKLKLSNVMWMNWAEQEIHFRHKALPGTGQITEWNVPRRSKGRCWTHLRWGRLGLMHYLGKKGFYEQEIEGRIGDERWIMEHDAQLDKYGLLMTEKRKAKARKAAARKERKKGKGKANPTTPLPTTETEGTQTRIKSTNIHRSYSTFEALPKNLNSWFNRDLRVVAPEGISYWLGKDTNGKPLIVLVVDPRRGMRQSTTKELTPSLTYMPRAMEIESFTEDELTRVAGPEETYLDPPPPPFTKEQLREEKEAAASSRRINEKKAKMKQKMSRLKISSKQGEMPDVATLEESFPKNDDGNNNNNNNDDDDDDDNKDSTMSEYSSDEELNEDYEKKLREEYLNPKKHTRDREFARKYAMTTHDLVCRYLCQIPSKFLQTDPSAVTVMLGKLVMDDFWQLLAEMRLDLDHLDNDLSGSLYEQLIESIGNTKRQDLTWMRAMLQEIHEWVVHMESVSSIVLRWDEDLIKECNLLKKQIEALQTRTESTLSVFASTMALAQSALVIEQTSGINKVTELAFFFVPVSFITSIFSMQIAEFTNSPPRAWTWGLSISLIVLLTYFIRSSLRSPSVRAVMINFRATINARFASKRAGSPSQRFRSVGNRAILKFILFFCALMGVFIPVVLLYCLTLLLIYFLIWAGAAGTALYFIITHWPEPAVLAPCFIGMALSALGAWYCWRMRNLIADFCEGLVMTCLECIRDVMPSRWLFDSVDDEDLLKEGVSTYARQALTLMT